MHEDVRKRRHIEGSPAVRKTIGSNRLGQLLGALLVGCILISSGQSKILDPRARHPLLRKIAGDLHRDGIDVVQSWRSRVQTGARPIVAPLANYQISLAPKEEQWISDFNRSAVGAVAAIETNDKLQVDAFATRWSETPKERRVFISFAREDVATAQRVKIALEANGYVAFVYLNRAGEQPSRSPAEVGEYLRTAGTHLVLDTEIARMKRGVLAEALAFASYTRSPANYRLNNQPNSFGPDALREGGPIVGSNEKHIVEIYGAKKRCPRTRQAIQLFKDAGAEVRYFDVDTSARAAKVVEGNTRWLEGGQLLPLIRVDGKPIRATSAGVGRALELCRVPK